MQRKHNKDIVPTATMLRKNMTKEEKHLWYDFLRTYPVRFLRQKVLGKYIADFYCAEAKLVIELDGSEHYTPEAKLYDAIRSEFLSEYGLLVVRILNREVNQNFYGVCEYIDKILEERVTIPQSQSDSSLYTREPYFLFPKVYPFFLTSTAFVDTKAKYGIPLLRYAVFL